MRADQADRQLAALGIEASAELAVTVGRLADQIQQAARQQAELDSAVRFIKPPPVLATIGAAGTVTMDMDGPKTGYMWTVRSIAVSDAAALVNSMGSALAFVYAGQPSPLLISPENVEWIMPVLPNVTSGGPGELVLQYGEHLLVQVAGGTPGQAVKCKISYQLYRQPLASRTQIGV